MPRTRPATFTLQQGTPVYYQGLKFVILHLLDLEYVLAKSISDGEIKRLKITDITKNEEKKGNINSESIIVIPDKDWHIAQQRLEIIQPLVYKPNRTKLDVEKRAEEYNLHINSLYKWLKLYENSGLLTSLTPKKRKSGTTTLSPEVEAIIHSCIETEYLTLQRKSIPKLHRVIQKYCLEAGLPVPHCNTVRNRVNALSDQVKTRRRYGNKAAVDSYHMDQGSFPGADYPYAVIQIDHTLLDIILVDDEHRLPLTRPWITVAIDIFSRMVVGFYLSFDTPGAIGTGMCLAHSIMTKDKWLAGHNVSTTWPCWGLPKTVHADNAKEFRGRMLQLACEEYGINLEWRPVAQPQYGGHIERLLGTFSKEIHELPGSTFSNILKRKGYDSDKNSALTIKEFEQWIAIYITEVYHQKEHSALNCPPIKKYEEGIFGTNKTKGIGLPARIEDETTLQLNFLPYVERTIQDYGVLIDGIYYYHDVLRAWNQATVKGKSKLKRKFIFRRDPRDISTIWFFDPELTNYFPIPYRNLSYPSMTLWELKKIRGELKAQSKDSSNEHLIFEAYEKMLEIEKASVLSSKKSRRAIQRRKSAKDTSLKVIHEQITSIPELPDDDIEITPFDDMEELD